MARLGPYLLGPNAENQGVYTGDARELAKAIPDESVDLIFTDPVYQNIDDYRWLAETAARVLKDGGDVLAYCGHYQLAAILRVMSPPLDYRWILVEKKISTGALIWSYRLYSHYIPLLWLTKGKPTGKLSRIDFQWGRPNGAAVNHKWSKNLGRMAFWLSRFVARDAIGWDPFCGGGAMPSALKATGRRWFAFEIEPDVAASARERIRNTQAPLPGLVVPQQKEMAFS